MKGRTEQKNNRKKERKGIEGRKEDTDNEEAKRRK